MFGWSHVTVSNHGPELWILIFRGGSDVLSIDIITFATLTNAAILFATLWQSRRLHSHGAVQVTGGQGKTFRKMNLDDFELPDLEPIRLPTAPPPVPAPENVPAATPVAISQQYDSDPWMSARLERRSTRRRDFVRPTIELKKCVQPGEAVELLLEYMNAEGRTGLFTAAEIDLYWSITVELYDLEYISPQFVRSAMGRFHQGQKRLNTPEFAAIRQRTGQTRANLYRIPKCRAVAGSEAERTGTTPEGLVAQAAKIPVISSATGAAGKPAASHSTHHVGQETRQNASNHTRNHREAA